MWFIGEKDLFRVDGEWLLVNGEWKLESGCWILQAVSSSARRKEGVSRTGLRINASSRYNFTLLRAVKPLEVTRFRAILGLNQPFKTTVNHTFCIKNHTFWVD